MRHQMPLVTCVLCVVAACTKAGAHAAAASTGNACDRKLLTPADAGGILSEPISGTRPVPGDPQSCELTTAGSSGITVSLRPGLGRTTVETWTAGRMPVPATPLAGVGDEAAWADALTEVIAEKNDLLCDVQVSGLAPSLRKGPAPGPEKAIGALCNTIFGRVQ